MKLNPIGLNPADLEGLLHSCRRNGRPAIKPRPADKIFFDADRFRWWFRYGCNYLPFWEPKQFKGMTIQQIRDWMDSEMRKHPEQVHT